MAFRFAGDSFLALAFPPFRPPMLPSATAWGLRVSGSGCGNGLPSIRSPMACSTMARPISMKSRFGLERFGMTTSCHGSRTTGSPVEIIKTHYQGPLFLKSRATVQEPVGALSFLQKMQKQSDLV
jgi:hypothetical protein